MPRIRTTKPEFWADEGIAALPRDARLLLLGMFNFADDHGRMRGSPLLIRSQVFPYDADVDVEGMLGALASPREASGGKRKAGFIHRYEVDGESFIWIRNFTKHQKIDHPSKPIFPEPPPADSQPTLVVAEPILASPREPSRKIALDQGSGNREQGRDQGKDLPAPPETAAQEPAPTAAVWLAYSAAYELRYKARPPDNAKARSQLKQFLQRVPREEAPFVAASYLQHNDALYVRAKHPIDLLLRDYQKLHTEWQTGQQVTGTEARQIEKTQAGLDGWEAVRRAT